MKILALIKSNIKTGIVFCLLPSLSFSQFIDFNLFKPSTTIKGEFVPVNPSDSFSIGIREYNVSTLIPLKRKLDVDLELGNIFKSKGPLDALKKVINPKISQTFARVGLGSRTYNSSLFSSPMEVYNFSGGFSKYSLQLKSGKLRLFVYHVNLKLEEQVGFYKSISPSVSGLIGSARILDYKSAFFYGLYGNYFGKRFIPFPILAYYRKFSLHTNLLLAFPYQAQYSFKLNHFINQNLTISLNAFNNGLYNDSLVLGYTNDRLNFTQTSVRFSSQTRFRLVNKLYLYTELGWQDYNKFIYFDGYKILQKQSFKGGFFIHGKITYVFGKSIVNPSLFELNL